MSEKQGGNVWPETTCSRSLTNSSTSWYEENKVFNQWWEHWMSKVNNRPLSAKGKTATNAGSRFSYSPKPDDVTKEKKAA